MLGHDVFVVRVGVGDGLKDGRAYAAGGCGVDDASDGAWSRDELGDRGGVGGGGDSKDLPAEFGAEIEGAAQVDGAVDGIREGRQELAPACAERPEGGSELFSERGGRGGRNDLGRPGPGHCGDCNGDVGGQL